MGWGAFRQTDNRVNELIRRSIILSSPTTVYPHPRLGRFRVPSVAICAHRIPRAYEANKKIQMFQIRCPDSHEGVWIYMIFGESHR